MLIYKVARVLVAVGIENCNVMQLSSQKYDIVFFFQERKGFFLSLVGVWSANREHD